MPEKRLIYADEVKKPIVNWLNWHTASVAVKSAVQEIVEIIDEAPTIDAVEVIHAYWMDGTYCSNCRAPKARPWAAYLEQKANSFCNVCGAKMDAKTPVNSKAPFCKACEHSYWHDPECSDCGKENNYKYFQQREVT